jgi:hypothetical protein
MKEKIGGGGDNHIVLSNNRLKREMPIMPPTDTPKTIRLVDCRKSSQF